MRGWQTIRSARLDRHEHRQAYAAIVLAGAYEEAGDGGLIRVEAGDVVLHDGFEAHLNRFSGTGATVLNLQLPAEWEFVAGRRRVDDVDGLVRASESSGAEAARELRSALRTAEPAAVSDWPEMLASEILRDPSVALSRWSESHGLTAWAVSRGFLQVFGVSPSGFRARVRARRAWKAIERGDTSLAAIAAELGFADQAHMTRSVRQLTGLTPAALRRACK